METRRNWRERTPTRSEMDWPPFTRSTRDVEDLLQPRIHESSKKTNIFSKHRMQRSPLHEHGTFRRPQPAVLWQLTAMRGSVKHRLHSMTTRRQTVQRNRARHVTNSSESRSVTFCATVTRGAGTLLKPLFHHGRFRRRVDSLSRQPSV